MKTRFIIFLTIAMLTALTGFCALIYYDTGRAKQLDITDMSLNAMNLQYHIELVDDSSDRLEVRGWAFIKGESIGKYDMHVVLKMDNSKNTYYQIPTKMIIRKDITHLFTEPKMENSPNYDKAGFNGRVWLNRLSRLPRTNYTICLAYNNAGQNVLVETPEVITLH